MERVESKKNRFLKLTPENGDYNQYWFSEKTIEFIATPSIFFSLSKEMQNKSYLFDIDEKLTKKHKNGKRYDFNESDYEVKFPDLKNSFDYLVIDPPFITQDSWTKFSNFALYLKNDNCKIIACSIAENKENLKNLLDLDMKVFQPSIPHLVYQYNIFANYDDEELNKKNPEIPE